MTGAAASEVTVEVLEGAEGMTRLRDEWHALYHRNGSELSLSYAWSDAVVSVYGVPGDRLRTIAVRRHAELIGLLPLITRRARRSFWHVTPLAEEHNTHSDWLAAEHSSEIAGAFVRGLIAAGVTWDRFRMSRVLAGNPLLPHFVAALQARGIRVLLRAEPPSYVMRLPPTYAEYLAARSAKFRNHLKRVHKKIHARHAEVAVLAGDQSASGFTAAFARMLAIEQGSWKGAHQWAMFPDSAATRFWRAVCGHAWAEGRVHAQFLAIDGRPAAYNLGYIIGEEYAYLKTTFSDEFRDLGAATFLRARLVEDLIGRGIRVVDFPGEPYDWERQWTTELRRHVMLTAYSGTIRSRLLEVLERIRHGRHPRLIAPAPPQAAATDRRRREAMV